MGLACSAGPFGSYDSLTKKGHPASPRDALPLNITSQVGNGAFARRGG